MATTREQMDAGDVRKGVEDYRAYHESTGGTDESRKADYSEMVQGYYDLATDFYERGWGKSFHFAPRRKGESFETSLARHQHYLALRLGLGPGTRALDVGCGVGGPLREIAQFSGAHVTGVNNNAYQVGKARQYNREAGLESQTEVIETDFMSLPFEDASFDGIYGIEATCHAPSFPALLKELHRVLKPGGRVAIYEWCLTAHYDGNNANHRKAKADIEEGNGLPDIASIAARAADFDSSEFALLDSFDKTREDPPDLPWYQSLAGRDMSNVGLRRSPVGRKAMSALVKGLEFTKVAPKGTFEIQSFLSRGADALVYGGETATFTPMAFFLAEKR